MLFLFISGRTPAFRLTTSLAIILFLGCSEKPKSELAVFKAVDESLGNSNLAISNSTDMVYAALREKLTDPAIVAEAEIWQPKATRIKKISFDMFKYIEELKVTLKKEAGLKVHEGREIFSEGDENVVEILFAKRNKGHELFEKLVEYRRNIFAVDKEIDSAFHYSPDLMVHLFDSTVDNPSLFVESFFENAPVVGALAFLSKIQNSIKITENKMMIFCNNKCRLSILICTFPYPIVNQSSSIVRAGEELEITAGMASFSWSVAKPEIIVNGKVVETDQTGIAVTKLKSSSRPGRHFIPVRITYIDQDQKKQTIEKTVEYTVTAELAEIK